MTDDKQPAGMTASEGLEAFTAFAKHMKDKPMWVGERRPMTSKLEDIRERVEKYEAAKEAWGKMPPSLSRVAEECNVDMLYSDLTANAPDDLRALLAVVDAAQKIVANYDEDGFGLVTLLAREFHGLRKAVDELTKGGA